MKAVQVINPGENASLKIDEFPTPEMAPHQVLVKVKATALNRADLLQRKGKYPPPEGASPIMGLEMAGVVEAAGNEVTRWKKGDRVFGLLPGGGYAEYAVIHERMAMRIPDDMNFEEAAAVPETFLTAYQALCWLGDLQQNETVLIHAGGSGVGTSAIQIAREYNADIITTAGKDFKLEACRGLGAKLALNYHEGPFADPIEEQFGKNSVNLIIDFVGKPYWNQNIRILSLDGRVVYLSMLGGTHLEDADIGPILRKRLTIRGSTLRSRDSIYKIRLTEEFAEFALELFERKRMKPVVDQVFDWKDTEEAHRYMAENRNTGKIVLNGM